MSPADDWLLVVELVRGSNNPSSVDLRRAAKRRGLRVAWVFHDDGNDWLPVGVSLAVSRFCDVVNSCGLLLGRFAIEYPW